MVVPTGIGAAIGGFAGDALPAAKLLSTVADVLITHPNVMNGAMLYWPVDNILYVEGYALDEFAEGRVALVPTGSRGNRVGLLLDKGIEEDLLLRHVQVADAFRATLGIDVAAAVVTSEPVGVSTFLSPSGASWGSVQNTNTLVEGAQELLRLGCDAVAIVARFPEDEEDEEDQGGFFQAYRQGLGVDAIAGAEALISHVISKRLMVPCAHAPAFAPSELFAQTTPKACAEELGYTFLPCVLAYLHKAPRLLPLPQSQPQAQAQAQVGGLVAGDVDCVVAPAGALGGAAVLSLIGRHTHNTLPQAQAQAQGQGQGQASKRGLLLISVGDNASNMRATPRALGLDVVLDPLPPGPGPGAGPGAGPGVTVVHARSYAEAAGLMAAHKSGILLPSIGASVPPLGLTRL
jgi:hypothetical protein